MLQVDILVAQAVAREQAASLERRAQRRAWLAEIERSRRDARSGARVRRSVGAAVIRVGEALAGQAREEFGGAGGRLSSAG